MMLDVNAHAPTTRHGGCISPPPPRACSVTGDQAPTLLLYAAALAHAQGPGPQARDCSNQVGQMIDGMLPVTGWITMMVAGYPRRVKIRGEGL